MLSEAMASGQSPSEVVGDHMEMQMILLLVEALHLIGFVEGW